MDYDTGFEDGYQKTSLGSLHFKHHSGAKATMVFLHGMGGNTKAFAKLVGHLPDDLDVYIMDLLGHGLSDAPKIDYTVDVQVKAIREFISARNLDCYLFGHSYGGWVSVLYAASGYPCRGLIIEDSAGSRRQIEDMKGSGSLEAKNAQLIRDALAINGNREYVIKSLVENNVVSTLSAEEFASVGVPSLVIWGSDDQLVNIRYSSDFSKINGSRTEVIEGGGHYPHYTKPEQVAGLILGFIA